MSLSVWTSSDDPRDGNLGSDVASSSDRPKVTEVPNFGPFWINSILTLEDLEVIRLRYQIPIEFKLQVTVLEECIALLHQDRVGFYEESLNTDLRLSFNYLVVELLNTYRVSPCSIVLNS